MSKNRRHHYVAAFHLAHFTHGGGQEDRLTVFDLHEQRSWASTPRGTGHAKDFYRVESEGVDPLMIEKDFLHAIEGPGARAFDAILRAARGAANMGMARALVDHEHLYALLRFVAVQSVRGPDQRVDFDNIHTEVAVAFLQQLARNQEMLEQRKAENPALSDLTREDINDLLSDHSFRVVADQTSQIQSVLQVIPQVLERLIVRSWKISVAPPGAAPLVCTDKPVVLIPHPSKPDGMPFGFGTPGTSVLMPLGQSAVLVGHWLFPPQPSDEHVAVDYLSPDEIPTINTLIVGAAHRYVYCADDDLVLVTDGRGGVGGRKELFADAARAMRVREQHARRRARQRSR